MHVQRIEPQNMSLEELQTRNIFVLFICSITDKR